MRRLPGVGAAVLLALAGCGDDDTTAVPAVDETPSDPAADPAEPEGEPVIDFTWTTTMDVDGFGYILEVAGAVGEGHAAYTMQVDPLLGAQGGDYADLLPGLAGFVVNGFAESGEGVELSTGDAISTEGSTLVRVIGDERWYRNPWLLDEAAFALDGAEWVRVTTSDTAIADVVTAVLNERYDDALRRLLDAVERGEPVQAPPPEEGSSELDEILTPWIGLAGPEYPIGGDATVTGDASAGEVAWTQTLTYEPDGADGALEGVVEWSTGRGEPPSAPESDDVIDVARMTAQLAG